MLFTVSLGIFTVINAFVLVWFSTEIMRRTRVSTVHITIGAMTVISIGVIVLLSSELFVKSWADTIPVDNDGYAHVAIGAVIGIFVGTILISHSSGFFRIRQRWLSITLFGLVPLLLIISLSVAEPPLVQSSLPEENAKSSLPGEDAESGMINNQKIVRTFYQLEFAYEPEITNYYRDSYSTSELVKLGTIPSPFSLTSDPAGNIYVGSVNTIFKIENMDSVELQSVSKYVEVDGRVYGLVYDADTLYAAVNTQHPVGTGRLLSIRQVTISPKIEILLEGLDGLTYGGHANNGITGGDDGLVYMTFGSDTDHLNFPEGHDRIGKIMTYNPVTRELQTIADGFRNPWDITACSDGAIYATDNGPNKIDDTLFFRPPDEVNRIIKGRSYGHPDVFGSQPGWSASEAPYSLLPMSGGVTGIICHSGNGNPQWKNRLFMALSGSTEIPEQTGKRILILQPDIENGVEFATWTTSADGLGTPADLMEHHDRSILILDFGMGNIQQINLID